MALTGIAGTDPHQINHALMQQALGHLPAILIDCANAADPHRFYPLIDVTTMQQIYVFELELLHKFRDCLKYLPRYAKQLRARIIVVTSSDYLFNYHNEEENRDIYIHAWQLMRKIGLSYDIVVGISPGSMQYDLAKKHCRKLEVI